MKMKYNFSEITYHISPRILKLIRRNKLFNPPEPFFIFYRVDFAQVQEQARWVCGCDNNTVKNIEEDFKVENFIKYYRVDFSRWIIFPRRVAK